MYGSGLRFVKEQKVAFLLISYLCTHMIALIFEMLFYHVMICRKATALDTNFWGLKFYGTIFVIFSLHKVHSLTSSVVGLSLKKLFMLKYLCR